MNWLTAMFMALTDIIINVRLVSTQKIYYPSLTGLRAFAAFLVYFYHTNPFATEGWQSFLHSFVNEFHVGVSVFFVLSGFLIYSRYAAEISTEKKWFWSYVQNRFARIYPLYFILTTLLFAFILLRGSNSDNVIFIYLVNITFLKGFFNDLKFTGISQSWSLTVEECFYFLAPFIFVWTRKIKVIPLTITLLFIGIAFVYLFHFKNEYGFFFDVHFMMVYTFFGRCFEFLAGAWIAQHLMKFKLEKTGTYTYNGFFLLLLTIVSLSLIHKDNGSTSLDSHFGIAVNNFFLPLTVACVIIGLVRENTPVSRILSSSYFQLLGKSSYALYLIHAGLYYKIIYTYVTTNAVMLFFILNLIAIALYFFIEKPLNEKLKAN